MAQLSHTFTENQPMQVASHLAKNHGFEPSPKPSGSARMVKIVDDQHAVIIIFSSKMMKRVRAEDAADGASIGKGGWDV